MDYGLIVTFIIVSFCLALLLIIKKDTLAPQARRPLALIALVMIVVSFFLLMYTILNAGR
ncbi:hypothetical protein MJA45_19380 [Paenibacillus aurantius]|uniref:Signal transduction histidine kinase n=1 Tax=Paenibacillus aurantius TaxID=2918900 RepID=A0AA96LA06_9BACL|nr:hypothetical protein [Paenibacillus aurantius]WJH34558.1 hypothetical protein N6H14_33075 [Paenibacillus sp. CC-CFT747]WNQ09771.1 hypothetical protein MJA45_19380 [Paenibacillus aurantius]